jgi:hypothetical protein
MKAVSWELTVVWEDGVECESREFAPSYVVEAVEQFIENWEEAENEEPLVMLH